MPLVNIIDSRTRPHRYKTINAVIEASWHDHSVSDGDAVFDEARPQPDYDELEHVSLAGAVAVANNYSADVTLYLYDEDGGIYPLKETP